MTAATMTAARMTAAKWKFTQILMSLALAFGLTMAPVQDAEAGHKGARALAAGIAIGVIGSAIIGNQRRRGRRHRRRRHRVQCYNGPRQCGFVGVRDCWIDHHGSRICEGGQYRCWRERFCD